eukprot:TRINITY_DN22883_c0_g1_i1.p1 TRINITY_DN22883_c0_g1~~TRINITY_DN22883_c0_g1_i1.p1  ORF type:complete len:377 (+),score=109.64 TRINITY_DN22883_c0_g1_i1:80-1132(+)
MGEHHADPAEGTAHPPPEDDTEDGPPMLVPVPGEVADRPCVPVVVLTGSERGLGEVLPQLLREPAGAEGGILVIAPGFLPCLHPLVEQPAAHRVGLRGGHACYMLVGDLSTLQYAVVAERPVRCAVVVTPPATAQDPGGFCEWLLGKDEVKNGWEVVRHVVCLGAGEETAEYTAELRLALCGADCVACAAGPTGAAAAEPLVRRLQPLAAVCPAPEALARALPAPGGWAALPEGPLQAPPTSPGADAEWVVVRGGAAADERRFARLVDRFVYAPWLDTPDAECGAEGRLAAARGVVGGRPVRCWRGRFDDAAPGEAPAPAAGGWLVGCSADAAVLRAFAEEAALCFEEGG